MYQLHTIPNRTCVNCEGPLVIDDWTANTVEECHLCTSMKRDFSQYLKKNPTAAAKLLKSLNEIYDK